MHRNYSPALTAPILLPPAFPHPAAPHGRVAGHDDDAHAHSKHADEESCEHGAHGTHDHDAGHSHAAHTDASPLLPTGANTLETWRNGILATALISSASLVTMPFLDLLSRPSVLKLGMAFAVGGLLGDVFLHIVPHEMGGHDHHQADEHAHDEHAHDEHSHDEHSHEHGHEHSHSLDDLRPGLLIISGIVIFLAIDKAMRAAMGGGAGAHSHSHDGHGHSTASGAAPRGPGRTAAEKNKEGSATRGERSPSPSVSKTAADDNEEVATTKTVAKSCEALYSLSN